MERPMFSVIVPVYNSEKYLHDCVNSILGQTFQDFELILVDDGSYDQSPTICEEYAEKDIRVKVFHKKNEGVVSARNLGLDKSHGEYISCIDSDDFLDEQCLHEVYVRIRQHSPDIICFGMRKVYNNRIIDFKPEIKQDYLNRKEMETYIFPSLIQGPKANCFSPNLANKIIRRSIIVKNRIEDNRVAYGEDGACTIACIYHATSMAIIHDCFYNYRMHNDSATNSKRVFQWDTSENVADFTRRRIDASQSDFNQQIYRKISHGVFLAATSQFNRTEPFMVISRDIKKQLNRPCYDDAIKKCRFSFGSAAYFMNLALRYRLTVLMYAYNKMSNIKRQRI